MTTHAAHGRLRLAGSSFEWSSLSQPSLEDWAYFGPAGEARSVRQAYLTQPFLATAVRVAAGASVLSKWFVFQSEFEWHADAPACGCLKSSIFAEVCQTINGDAVVPTPGPVFDRFLIRRSVLDQLDLGPDSDVTAREWADVVGLDSAYFTPGHPDFSESSTLVRDAFLAPHSGDAHEAYLRAFDAYFYGGLPARVARTMKGAFLNAVEGRQGHTYLPGDAEKVTRRMFNLNATCMESSLCCTTVLMSGTRVFTTELERIAETSRSVARIGLGARRLRNGTDAAAPASNPTPGSSS